MARHVRAVPVLVVVALVSSLSACSTAEEPAPFALSESPAASVPVVSASVAPTTRRPSPSASRPPGTATPRPSSPGGPASANISKIQVVGSPAAGSPYAKGAQVVVAYLDAQITSLTLRSTADLTRLSGAQCTECQYDLKIVKQRIASGEHLVRIGGGAAWSSVSLYSRKSSNPRNVQIKAIYVEPPSKVVDKAGRTIGQHLQPLAFESTFVLSPTRETYVVQSISTRTIT